jgi:hypothetical protein
VRQCSGMSLDDAAGTDAGSDVGWLRRAELRMIQDPRGMWELAFVGRGLCGESVWERGVASVG